MGELKPLQAIAGLGLLPHYIQNGVDQFRALGVVAFGPVVSCACLPEDEIVLGGGEGGKEGGELRRSKSGFMHGTHLFRNLCCTNRLSYPPSLLPSLSPSRTRTKELAEGTGTDTVHGARLQIHQDGARHVPPTGCLIEVDINSLQL